MSCKTKREFPDVSNEVDFQYKQLRYSDTDLEEIRYFSDDSLIIEAIGFESRKKFIYDSNNSLIETYSCGRGYNCQSGSRKLHFYDKSSNIIGFLLTSDSTENRDTIKFEQTKFYNIDNQITRELVFRANGYETWKNYDYCENHIIREFEIRNSDTIWIGNYTYDRNNNLSQLSRRFNDKYEIEIFSYNKSNKLKTHTITSNEYKIDKYTSYSVNNNRTEYLYYKNGLIKEKAHFNHLGKEIWRNIYKYETKKY